MRSFFYKFMFFTSLSLFGTVLANAQSTKEKIKQCKDEEISNLIEKSRRQVPQVAFAAHCEPGNIQGFPPHCGGIENNVTPASITSSPGYHFVPGTAVLIDNGSNTPSRTGIEILSNGDKQVSARAWCNGHGCGGEGAIDARGILKANEELVPTSQDYNNALEKCVDKFIPQ